METSRWVLLMVILAASIILGETTAPVGLARGSELGRACTVVNAPTQRLVAPNIAEVGDTSVVSCPTTTAAGPAVDGRPRQGARSGYTPTYQPDQPPPATEQPCATLYAKQPAAISYGQWGPQLDWLRPDGAPQTHVNGDMPSAPTPSDSLVPLDFAAAVAGQNHLFVWYRNDSATYGGTHGWECLGGNWTFRDSCTYRSPNAVACAQTRVTGPLRSATGGPPDPAPLIRSQLGSIQRQVNAGTIGTSPTDPARQYTFLPSCFWVTGVNNAQTFELRIQEPTFDASTSTPDGRAITYVYRINVGLQSVRWEYGDGASRNGVPGTPWTAAAPDTCSNDHTYERISTHGNPGAVPCPVAGYPHTAADDECYRVQAEETYAVTVNAYWFDGAGPHAPIDMGTMAPLVISPDPTYVRVQQVEGVPVTR